MVDGYTIVNDITARDVGTDRARRRTPVRAKTRHLLANGRGW